MGKLLAEVLVLLALLVLVCICIYGAIFLLSLLEGSPETTEQEAYRTEEDRNWLADVAQSEKRNEPTEAGAAWWEWLKRDRDRRREARVRERRRSILAIW